MKMILTVVMVMLADMLIGDADDVADDEYRDSVGGLGYEYDDGGSGGHGDG